MKRKNQYNPKCVFHPGMTLKEKLEEMRISPEWLSSEIGISVEDIMAIIQEKKNISPKIAKKLENGLKIPLYLWLNMQKNYEKYKYGL